jgi:hypothetical protein
MAQYGSSARYICLGSVLESCTGVYDYSGFHFYWSLRSKPSRSTDIPPHAAQLAATLQVQQVAMCPIRAVFSPWEPVAACIRLSTPLHDPRSTKEHRKPTRGFQVMAIGVPQQGECACTCTCVSSKPLYWTSSAHHMPERCAEELSRA